MGLGEAVHNERIMVDPERRMAELLTRELGHEVTPERVVEVFRNHWARLSILAHAIHDQQIRQES